MKCRKESKIMEELKLFDDYVAQRLNSLLKEEFEKKLMDDRAFASDFKIYLFVVKGIIQEAKQDNADFATAMKHISKDELLNIIGRNKVSRSFINSYLRERIAWISSLAAVFIIGLGCVFFTWQSGSRNIDNMIVSYNYYAETKDENEYIDINEMSRNEVKEYIPVLIFQYEHCPTEDIQACQDAGMRIALAYLKIHDRKETRKWLHDLKEKYASDVPFVKQCQKILNQIE